MTENNKADSSSQTTTQRLEFNPRVGGYAFMTVFSLAALFSIALKIADPTATSRGCAVSITFLCIATATCILVVLGDFFNSNRRLGDEPANFMDLKNAKDSREKYILIALFLSQVIIVTSSTFVGGVAYSADNIYFSVWVNFYLSLYILNDWMQEKNEICFRDLTHFSETLPGWYALLLSSTIVFGSVLNGVEIFLNDQTRSAVAIAIIASLISMIISSTVILSFYKLCLCCSRERQLPVRGWWEFTLSLGLAVLWIAEVVMVTQFGSFGATASSSRCHEYGDYKGSNLYYFSWMSFVATGYIISQWKAERALEFAQTNESGVIASEREIADTETSKEQGDSDI